MTRNHRIFLIVSLDLSLIPSTTPFDIFPLAWNQFKMSSRRRRHIRAIFFIGSIRERSTSRHQPSRNLPAQVGEAKTAISPVDHRTVRQRPVREVAEVAEAVAGRQSYRARVARHTSPGLQPATVRTGPSI